MLSNYSKKYTICDMESNQKKISRSALDRGRKSIYTA